MITTDEHVPGSAECWCCGQAFPVEVLQHLGTHPEVAICAGCAQSLHRRARLAADEHRRRPGAVLRRGFQAVRARVIRRGWHYRPILGRLLRRLDRNLP